MSNPISLAREQAEKALEGYANAARVEDWADPLARALEAMLTVTGDVRAAVVLGPRIQNTDQVEPGTMVMSSRGRVVFEVLETSKVGPYLKGRLRDTRTGRSAGWEYLHYFNSVTTKENA